MLTKPQHSFAKVLSAAKEPESSKDNTKEFHLESGLFKIVDELSPRDTTKEKQESKEWTSDDRLLRVVNDYFDALTEMAGRPCAYNPILNDGSDSVRTEYRNLFMIMNSVEKHSTLWQRRVIEEKRKMIIYKQTVETLQETVARMNSKLKSVECAARKYSVNEATQRNAIDLATIRFEDLNMVGHELLGLSQDSGKSGNEFDVSNASERIPDGSKYEDLAMGDALATASLFQITQLSKQMKRRRKSTQKLRKTSQQLDKELSRLQKELQYESSKVFQYASIIEKTVASEAWQKKNGIL